MLYTVPKMRVLNEQFSKGVCVIFCFPIQVYWPDERFFEYNILNIFKVITRLAYVYGNLV